MPTVNSTQETREFSITVLGRTLEHLGVQMYKRRDVAIAELVANCWDAGAENVYIRVPDQEHYDQVTSSIVITDDGIGMDADQIQEEYLVVGRNRRRTSSGAARGRLVMGRKGIGKLAGFGVATRVQVTTWREETATTFTLDLRDLKGEDGQTEKVPIVGVITSPPSDIDSSSGTRIVLADLKHKTPLDLNGLREALGRRFSRTVRGQMKIFINGDEMGDPVLDLETRLPDDGVEYESIHLSDGTKIRYSYGFAKEPISSAQMRGFTIYVAGKTAQAPPFFFNVEGTASGQHGTRYVTGAIEADFLDEGSDDESDLISTDRQEIAWEDESVQVFYLWGQELTRRLLRDWATRKGEVVEDHVLANSGLHARLDRLDPPSRAEALRLIRQMGKADPAPEATLDLADTLIRAYEYRQFHDVVNQIDAVGDEPDQLQVLLTHLSDWKVLESRAILEVIKGRIDIVDKFHSMILTGVPETARPAGTDNMHDLLAGSPWILNPDWQILSEETTISRQLREWGAEDVGEEEGRMRYDFLALADDHRLAIIEIKRSNHAVEYDELSRLEKYKQLLSRAHQNIYMVMVCSGTVNVSEDYRKLWENRLDGEITTWEQIYERTRRYYQHYQAVLRNDVDHIDFINKEREVARTRQILSLNTTYRNKKDRTAGLGEQDIDYQGL